MLAKRATSVPETPINEAKVGICPKKKSKKNTAKHHKQPEGKEITDQVKI